MKTISNYSKGTANTLVKIAPSLFAGMLLLISGSCQKDENFIHNKSFNDMDIAFAAGLPSSSSVLYFGHKIFTRVHGAPFTEKQMLGSLKFDYFKSEFIFMIKNGKDKKTRVSSAEIRIDGILIIGPADFSKNVSFITKRLCGLTPESILEVKLNSTPGGSIDLWIEGNLKEDVVTDNNGNLYKTVKIGDQWWMSENLKTDRYRNGDLIGTTTPATLDITSDNTPKYQWASNNNENNISVYGRLYTWDVVIDSRNLCPAGWHVPSSEEWVSLTNYLTNNGYGYDGSGADIAKSLANLSGWRVFASPGYVGNDQASNNSSGFTAVPGGYRFASGTFVNFGDYASWWDSSEINSSDAEFWSLHYNRNYLKRELSNKKQGIAVRCIKDKL